MSGALIAASGTSEFTGASLPSVGAQLLGQAQPKVYVDGDIQITTGAYSLHKTDDIILNESLEQDHPDLNMASRVSPDVSLLEEQARNECAYQNKHAILVQTNDVNVVESANTRDELRNNSSSSAQNLSNADRKPGQKQRARTNLRGTSVPRSTQKTS